MNKNSLIVAEKILQYTKANNGGTFLINGDSAELKDGYMVSLENYESMITLNAFHSRQLGFVANYIESIDSQIHAFDSKTIQSFYVCNDGQYPLYIGSWYDDGKLVMDISIHVPTLRMAMIFGERFHQKAIFDNKNKAVLSVDSLE
jgi:hypothetical protein